MLLLNAILQFPNPDPQWPTALILAGGKSTRMGQDKALIEIDGVPMLCCVWAIARQCSSRTYIVTPWIERYRAIAPEALWIEETYLPGEEPSQGPLVGLAQGLAHVTTDWVLLLACDLPCLQVEVLKAWIEVLPQVSEGAIACLPKHSKGWDPLCGFYRRSCLPQLNQYIERGGRSFQGWLATQTVHGLHLPDQRMLLNCNTLEDLETLGIQIK
jgi:molybdopterin-guanine dinucleotide biosynthesis protein A